MKKIFAFVVACVLAFILCCPFVSAIYTDIDGEGQYYSNGYLRLFTQYTFDYTLNDQYLGALFFTEPSTGMAVSITSDNIYLCFAPYLYACGIDKAEVTAERLAVLYNEYAPANDLQAVMSYYCQGIYQIRYVRHDDNFRLWLAPEYMSRLQKLINLYCDNFGLGSHIFPFGSMSDGDGWYKSTSVIYFSVVFGRVNGSDYAYYEFVSSIDFLTYVENAQNTSDDFVTWWQNFVSSINIVQLTSWLPSAMGTQIVVTFTSFMALIVILIVLKTIHG